MSQTQKRTVTNLTSDEKRVSKNPAFGITHGKVFFCIRV